jgi:hypothetical protein
VQDHGAKVVVGGRRVAALVVAEVGQALPWGVEGKVLEVEEAVVSEGLSR